MQIGVAYSEPAGQLWLRIEVAEDATVQSAIEQSGILAKFPHLVLGECTVGIFGRAAELDDRLKPGDRIEIYRPIIADPATVPRRKTASDEDDE